MLFTFRGRGNPAIKPELKKVWNCRSLQQPLWLLLTAIYGLRFLGSVFVLKGDFKEKLGRLRDFSVPRKPIIFSFHFFLFTGPGRTVTCSFYIYTASHYLIESLTVRCIFSSWDRHRETNDNFFRHITIFQSLNVRFALFSLIQFNCKIFTLYMDRSVRWSEELSFRANHRYIMSRDT